MILRMFYINSTESFPPLVLVRIMVLLVDSNTSFAINLKLFANYLPPFDWEKLVMQALS